MLQYFFISALITVKSEKPKQLATSLATYPICQNSFFLAYISVELTRRSWKTKLACPLYSLSYDNRRSVIRRQQRREEEARRLEEKAKQPKKTVVRRTEWEVECIKVHQASVNLQDPVPLHYIMDPYQKIQIRTFLYFFLV
jgi:hypothetical protein